MYTTGKIPDGFKKSIMVMLYQRKVNRQSVKYTEP